MQTVYWLTDGQNVFLLNIGTSLNHYKIIILLVLVVTGIVLQLTGTIDSMQLITIARQYADQWWLGVALVVIQSIMFTFAMAGSSMVWISAALFTPVVSTIIIVSGTTLGGISAYLFSEHLSGEWAVKVKHSRIYQLLSRQSNFISLFALRVMPGFPHSVINYSCGFLHIKFINFIPAAILGTAIKTYVYSVIIYNATTPGSLARGIDISMIWPLLALSLLILAATIVKQYLKNK